ncbi:MAG: P63C domain-containing protein, partial [Pseudomonadales bacterium]|nr:P63C domain-containing protein [Pseudomonadales bacterium]
KLRAFIADELRAWEKIFPNELWEEFARLVYWSGNLLPRPRGWGKLVTELIYEALDAPTMEYLRANTPESGARWGRQLAENPGVKQLVSRCYEVIGMARICRDMPGLKRKAAEHHGKAEIQYTLNLSRAA